MTKHSAGIAVLLVLSLAGTLNGAVRGPLVVSDRWPECTDLQTWVRDVFRIDGVQNASERDRAISFFNWLRLFNRVCEYVGGMAHAVEGPWGREEFVHDAHKHLFVYGWGHCSTHSLIAEALWQEYMEDPLAADRVIVMHEDGSYHTMFRLRIDGYYGAFDARYGYYLLEEDSPDARILDWDGVGEDRNIQANLNFKNRCRPFFEFPQKEFVRGLWVKPKPVFESEDAWRAAGTEPEVVFRDRKYQMGTQFHDMRFQLLRGMTIERYWDNSMKKWYVPRTTKDMFLPQGRFYRVGASMVGADGGKNDPNLKFMEPYFSRVPREVGYPAYLEGDRSLGQAWGRIRYVPNLSRGDLKDAYLSGNGLSTASEPPYVRPTRPEETGEWILDFYSPYVLVDGYISGVLAAGPNDQVEIAFRSQIAKRFDLGEPDQWLPWRTLASKPGSFTAFLDRTDAAEGNSSFHGAYRYQLRLKVQASRDTATAGLQQLQVLAYFENGIMSIPQIFDGENTIRFKIDDAAEVESDILVTYNWRTVDGEEGTHTKRLSPDLFYQENEAVYVINSPGLRRCDSLTVSYP